jgi:hypothetical protein
MTTTPSKVTTSTSYEMCLIKMVAYNSNSSPRGSLSPSTGHSPVFPCHFLSAMYSASSSSEEVWQQRGSRHNSVTLAVTHHRIIDSLSPIISIAGSYALVAACSSFHERFFAQSRFKSKFFSFKFETTIAQTNPFYPRRQALLLLLHAIIPLQLSHRALSWREDLRCYA